MKLILIRHGQTPSNIRGLLDTAVPGPGLTDLGHRQAHALVDALGGEPIESVYVSDLVRTQETAAPLAAALGLEAQVRPGLREISAGSLELRGDVVSVQRYLAPLGQWVLGNLDARMPDGPDGHETMARFDAVVEEIVASGRDLVAAVSHGAMIRAWTAYRARNLDYGFLRTQTLSNTGTVVLEHRNDSEWWALDWQGEAVGGPAFEDASADGPAADSIF